MQGLYDGETESFVLRLCQALIQTFKSKKMQSNLQDRQFRSHHEFFQLDSPNRIFSLNQTKTDLNTINNSYMRSLHTWLHVFLGCSLVID